MERWPRGGRDAPTATERARTVVKVGWSGSGGGAVCMAFERKFLINCLVNKSGRVLRKRGGRRLLDVRRGGGLDENGLGAV